MVRDLMISLGCLLIAIIGTILIIEGVVYGDEQDRRRVDRAEIRRLMEYHGTDCITEKDGVLYFERDGKQIRIRREP